MKIKSLYNTGSFKYNWYTKNDIDAFFGLFFDGFSKILAAVGIMIYGFGIPSKIVIQRIVPGIAVATLFGNLWYAYEAYSLAKKEHRQNVTAQPYGVGSGQVFGWLFLIIGPVYWDTNDPILAWQVGVAACFIGGLVEIFGGFVGKKIIKFMPTSALLGNLAAGSIVWLSLVGMLQVFDKPIIGLLPLLLILTFYLSKLKVPYGLPAGAIAIFIGTIAAWISGNMNIGLVGDSIREIKLSVPFISISDVIKGLKHIPKYLPTIVPLQIANFLTTLQGLESAAAAGDKYPVKTSMTMDGIGTVIGSLFGNPFPTTVYYGHPSWKEIGARAGYSVFNGLVYIIIGFIGAIELITAVIPYQAVITVLVFVGLETGSQAFLKSKITHVPAILIGFLPIIAQYIQTGIDAALQAAQVSLKEVGYASFEAAGFPIKGVISLSQGAFLSSLLLSAIVAFIIDKDFKRATVLGFLITICSFVGLIHAPTVEIASLESMPFTLIYLVFSIICLAIYIYNLTHEENKSYIIQSNSIEA